MPDEEVDRRARPKAVQRITRQQDRLVTIEADQLAPRTIIGCRTNRRAKAQRLLGPRRFNAQPLKRGDTTLILERFKRLDVPDGRGQHSYACR